MKVLAGPLAADRVPQVDTSSSEFRQQVSPLNVPEEGDPQVMDAARVASTASW